MWQQIRIEAARSSQIEQVLSPPSTPSAHWPHDGTLGSLCSIRCSARRLLGRFQLMPGSVDLLLFETDPRVDHPDVQRLSVVRPRPCTCLWVWRDASPQMGCVADGGGWLPARRGRGGGLRLVRRSFAECSVGRDQTGPGWQADSAAILFDQSQFEARHSPDSERRIVRNIHGLSVPKASPGHRSGGSSFLAFADISVEIPSITALELCAGAGSQ